MGLSLVVRPHRLVAAVRTLVADIAVQGLRIAVGTDIAAGIVAADIAVHIAADTIGAGTTIRVAIGIESEPVHKLVRTDSSCRRRAAVVRSCAETPRSRADVFAVRGDDGGGVVAADFDAAAGKCVKIFAAAAAAAAVAFVVAVAAVARPAVRVRIDVAQRPHSVRQRHRRPS